MLSVKKETSKSDFKNFKVVRVFQGNKCNGVVIRE